VKKILVFLMVGGLLGVAAASWLGPLWLSYWFRPPVTNNMLSCTREVEWAMSSLVKTQLGSALAGGVVVAIFGGLASRALRKRAERRAAAKESTAAAPEKPKT
jgi:hypothetical protein